MESTSLHHEVKRAIMSAKGVEVKRVRSYNYLITSKLSKRISGVCSSQIVSPGKIHLANLDIITSWSNESLCNTDVAPAERERKTVRCASTGFGPASSGFQVEATLWRHHSCGAILMAAEKTYDDPDEKIQTSPSFLWSENVHHECQVFGEGSVQSVYTIYQAWGLVETDNEENQSCQFFVPMPQCLQRETTDLFD
ncbi:hypothetical protein RRG08_049640 [Elysia crispata]|uniref:Uncharacterized protein n=1 Tax=Elysia crispata TaxID=231223 RepID=A0AAE1BDB5_9GAST|nr:hypothetical protein RRG08_049640 [Elysia crispata]